MAARRVKSLGEALEVVEEGDEEALIVDPEAQLRAEGVGHLVRALRERDEENRVSSLALPSNYIMDEGVWLLLDLGLEHLDLSDNVITNPTAMALAASPTLVSLDLSRNPISTPAIIALAQSKTLSHLSLESCYLGPLEAVILSQSRRLRFLNLTSNRVGLEGVVALTKCRHLKQLHIGSNELGDVELCELARARRLRYLDLSGPEQGGNFFTTRGFKALMDRSPLRLLAVDDGVSDAEAAVLASGRDLVTLNLGSLRNCVGPLGAAAIAATSTSLVSLNLSHNPVGTAGVAALLKNTRISSLGLCFADIDARAAFLIMRAPHVVCAQVRYNSIAPEVRRLVDRATRLHREAYVQAFDRLMRANLIVSDDVLTLEEFEDLVRRVFHFMFGVRHFGLLDVPFPGLSCLQGLEQRASSLERDVEELEDSCARGDGSDAEISEIEFVPSADREPELSAEVSDSSAASDSE